ncbi:hypothetical protein HOE425_200027 [Hoeflea sp. EC-HK425]|nr:hypothetical protein HOE425_200027 [Hoeflea sp. EC-HK425]
MLPHGSRRAFLALGFGLHLRLVLAILGGNREAQTAALSKSFPADLLEGVFVLEVFLQKHDRSPFRVANIALQKAGCKCREARLQSGHIFLRQLLRHYEASLRDASRYEHLIAG